MNESPSHLPNIKHPESKAAALLLVTLALIVAFVIFVMTARGVFEENQQLLLVAENSEGVAVGMDLTFSGFPIGRVNRIELGDDGKAHLHVSVPLKDARWLRASSVFTLEKGVVGGSRLRAFTGMLDDEPLADGARREVLMGDATSGVPELVATVTRLVGNLERLTNEQSALVASMDNLQRMTAEQSALAGSLNNMRQFTATLNGRHGALGALLGNDADVAKVIDSLEQTRLLLTEARASLAKVDAALVDVKAITGNTRAATEDLDALRAEIDLNLRKVSGLVDDLNRKWPFARERELKLP
ncbi:MlaD family protein [uncultured Azonexus sp.]|uniref:MlaD family protein n=1 Tax=uncultured Azonexus sp. TaxID=520307 RepID=UPI0026016145|nr:MlaD family protein [uncultured Azonexus sp.]